MVIVEKNSTDASSAVRYRKKAMDAESSVYQHCIEVQICGHKGLDSVFRPVSKLPFITGSAPLANRPQIDMTENQAAARESGGYVGVSA